MKTTVRIVVLLASLGTIPAPAQLAQHFDNIIIVVQENRTPDNLFGSGPARTPCNAEDPFEEGVDIENCGYDYKGNQVYLTSTSLTYPMNPGHDHASWLNQWDNNKMDGTCRNPPSGGYTTDQCFAYVPRSEDDPYFQIAINYGFANYMFQTNEAPSFPAHQFIISGSSAPTNVPTGNYTWFDADNTTDDATAGCANPSGTVPITPLIDNTGYEPKGSVTFCKNNPNDSHCAATCFIHNTWMSLWDSKSSRTVGITISRRALTLRTGPRAYGMHRFRITISAALRKTTNPVRIRNITMT